MGESSLGAYWDEEAGVCPGGAGDQGAARAARGATLFGWMEPSADS